jgi:hypothetical protein
MMPGDTDDQMTAMARRRVRVVRYWTHHQVAEMVGDVVISRQDIDGMPLQLWRIHTLPNQFRGMGIVQRMERPQYDINAIVNLKRDHQNLVLNPIAVIDEDLADINDGKVELYPGRTLISSGGDPKDKVFFYQPGMPPQGATEELMVEMEIVKDLAGLGPNQLGNFSQGRKTARETSAVAAGALGKIMTVALNLEDSCLEPIYLTQFKLEQRFMRAPDTFKYHGQHAVDWVQVTPGDYKYMAQPRFIAKGTSVVRDKEIHIQQFMMAADRALMAPQYHNLPVVFQEMWKLLVPLDYERFLADPTQNAMNIPPELENKIIAEGGYVEVSPMNDQVAHKRAHEMVKLGPDYAIWPESLRIYLDHHIRDHDAAGAQQQVANAKMGGQDASDPMRGIRGASMPETEDVGANVY